MQSNATSCRQRAVVRCQACKINLCVECQKRTHAGGNKRKHPITVYHGGKPQDEEEGMDEEAKKKKMTENVVSFLLVDETEEIQVSSAVSFLNVLGRGQATLILLAG